MNSKLIVILMILTTYFSGYAAEKIIKLQSNDNKTFAVSKKIFSDYSQTLRDMFEDIKEDDKETPIPLPNINSNTLDIIIQCVEHLNDAERILLSLRGQQL